ncbi:MAG TPA: hypothetical protein PKZ20_17340 [Rhodocyclaceae bacterium]|nr:hypothetical protein [Rhodocyclaceae bacterium]
MNSIVKAAKDLIAQIDVSDFRDENGIRLKMNICLDILRKEIEKYESERIDRKFEINLHRLD